MAGTWFVACLVFGAIRKAVLFLMRNRKRVSFLVGNRKAVSFLMGNRKRVSFWMGHRKRLICDAQSSERLVLLVVGIRGSRLAVVRWRAVILRGARVGVIVGAPPRH